MCERLLAHVTRRVPVNYGALISEGSTSQDSRALTVVSANSKSPYANDLGAVTLVAAVCCSH
jgi:hypothetical protein